MIEMIKFGENVRKIRLQKGLTQNDVARLSGKSANYICRVERGEFANPTFETVEMIARALEVSTSDLLYSHELGATLYDHGVKIEEAVEDKLEKGGYVKLTPNQIKFFEIYEQLSYAQKKIFETMALEFRPYETPSNLKTLKKKA